MADSTRVDGQYRDMNAGAHRRPAPQIAAPALTWQRTFWRPRKIEGAEAENGAPASTDYSILSEANTEWWNHIDNVLLHLFLHLCPRLDEDANFVSPNYERRGKLLYLFRNKINLGTSGSYKLEPITLKSERSVRHDIFSIILPRDGATIVVSAQLHLEYFVLMFAVDFSDQVIPAPEEREEKSSIANELAAIWLHLRNLHRLAIVRFSNNGEDGEKPKLSGDDEALVESSHQIMVRGFENYVDDLCSAAFGMDFARVGKAGYGPSLQFCGGVFADFFGVIYSLKLASTGLAYAALPKLRSDWRRSVSVQVNGKDFGDKAIDVLDAVWPATRRLSGRRKAEIQYGKPEYSASLFSNGQSLYVSSLGRLMPEPGRHDREKVVYTLVISYPSKWRSGRLIERINNLGVLRLSALRDLSYINDASDDINKVLDGVRRYQRIRNATGNDTAHLRNLLSQIGRDIDVGLQYRVGRSRYYVQLFDELIDILKPRRIEGFQLYTNFVRGRLQDTFDYIDRVGRRFDEIQQAVTFAISWNQRQVMEQLQSAITAQTAQMNKQAEETAINTRTTAHLLTAAEFLSVVPLTYYGGRILSDVLPAVPEFHHDILKLHHEMLNVFSGDRLYFALALVAAISLAATSNHLRHRSDKIPQVGQSLLPDSQS